MKKIVIGMAVLALVMVGSVSRGYCAEPAPAAIDITRGDMDSMAAVLGKYAGKAASVKLKSGKELSGKVVAVKNGMVHLSQLKGRDFYDAVISMDSVAAILVLR